jgi:hypothetical protein
MKIKIKNEKMLILKLKSKMLFPKMKNRMYVLYFSTISCIPLVSNCTSYQIQFKQPISDEPTTLPGIMFPSILVSKNRELPNVVVMYIYVKRIDFHSVSKTRFWNCSGS